MISAIVFLLFLNNAPNADVSAKTSRSPSIYFYVLGHRIIIYSVQTHQRVIWIGSFSQVLVETTTDKLNILAVIIRILQGEDNECLKANFNLTFFESARDI